MASGHGRGRMGNKLGSKGGIGSTGGTGRMDSTGALAGGHLPPRPARDSPAAASPRCSPLTDPHASQLQAALGYRAKHLLAELERGDADAPLARQLTPTSAALLRWWFADAITRTREDNFHPGQREAILHVVLAHEVFGDCDPQRLSLRAAGSCAAASPSTPAASAAETGTQQPRDMRLNLRSAPGTGQRWVLQALLLWQWANHMASRAAGREDARFSDRFSVLVPASRRQHWEDALLGPVAVAGLRTVGDAGVLRRMRLFLPPALRAPYRFWLMMQACAGDALRVLVDDDDGDATTTLVAGRGPRLASGLPAPAFTGAGAVPLLAPPSLRLTWRKHTDATGTDATGTDASDHGACVADFDPARAIRYGVAKLPVLACAPSHRPLPDKAAAQSDAHERGRPTLRRDHTAQLRLGLRALAHRSVAFASLDATRLPRMQVLCDTPGLLRAARARLRELGMGARKTGMACDPPDHGGIDLTMLCSPPSPDPSVCVLVVLRSAAPDESEVAPMQAFCTPAQWPEPELARLRAGNRERAAFGQPPDTLLDVLTVIEHRDALPLYAPWRRRGLVTLDPRPPEAVPPVGDVVATVLRSDAARFEIALPPTCADIAALVTPERLSALPRRLLRSSRALPVRKSIHPLAGWHEDDSGLRRGFIEAAERDPRIDSHCLLDPRRHACRHRDTLLALGMDGRGRVDALARTATHVFLIEFLPDRPGGAAAPHDSGERALRLWRRRTNTLPPEQRDHRLWRRVKLQAPLFWSCKRHDIPLSALLEALASTRSLVAAMPASTPVPATGQVAPAG